MTKSAYKWHFAGEVLPQAELVSVTMQDPEESEVCFPHFNSSCRKKLRSPVEALLTSSLLFCITLLTVALNLLVIISIYHFR